MRISHPFPILLVIKPFYHCSNYNNSNNNNCFHVDTCLNRSLPRRGSAAGKSDRFNFDDEEEEEVNSKRVWWSDYNYYYNNKTNNNVYSMDFEDDQERGGFGGVLEDSFHTTWVFKVLNAFGWMVPAIAISMLLGTGGTNTFLMALVLPLAQSVVSFISDTFLGDSIRSTKTKRRRTKKKPFRRAQSGTGMKQETNTEKVDESYEFQNATNNKPHAKREPIFGGWDELDQGLGSYKVPRREPNRMGNETGIDKKGKLSRQARTRGTPLLVRLLIAVFPFLGSWTRLL